MDFPTVDQRPKFSLVLNAGNTIDMANRTLYSRDFQTIA